MRKIIANAAVSVLFGYVNLGSAAAADLQILGKVSPCCGGQWSSNEGEFLITYRNSALPEGSQVRLHYGFKVSGTDAGVERVLVQFDSPADAMLAVVEPGVWKYKIEKQLYARGDYERITGLDFYFDIKYPDGAVVRDQGPYKGGVSFYEVPSAELGCAGGRSECLLPIKVVRKP